MPAYELRARARKTLGGSIFSAPWMYALLISLIPTAISVVLSFFSYVSFLSILIIGPLSFGLARYFVGRIRGNVQHDNIGIAFDGFKEDFVGNFLTGLLVGIFILLWMLVFLIPGIVKAYSYSMAFYIKQDHPDMSAQEAITESRKLMDGHKLRLFCLDLSFIGWMIVGALCFGVGTLWVSAYINAAKAEFYQDLKGSEPADQLPPPPAMNAPTYDQTTTAAPAPEAPAAEPQNDKDFNTKF